jgi:hypothetical protein
MDVEFIFSLNMPILDYLEINLDYISLLALRAVNKQLYRCFPLRKHLPSNHIYTDEVHYVYELLRQYFIIYDIQLPMKIDLSEDNFQSWFKCLVMNYYIDNWKYGLSHICFQGDICRAGQNIKCIYESYKNYKKRYYEAQTPSTLLRGDNMYKLPSYQMITRLECSCTSCENILIQDIISDELSELTINGIQIFIDPQKVTCKVIVGKKTFYVLRIARSPININDMFYCTMKFSQPVTMYVQKAPFNITSIGCIKLRTLDSNFLAISSGFGVPYYSN